MSPAAPGPALFRHDLPRWQHLVHPRWLQALLLGQHVEAVPAGDWRLFDVDCERPEAFLQAHIPGAVYLDTTLLEREPFWNAVPDAELLQVLADVGITRHTTVLLYGRNTTAAARAAQLMLYAGVADVRLLDGGLAAWTAQGLPVAQGTQPPYPACPGFGADAPLCPRYLVGTPQVRSLLAHPGSGVLASIRSHAEFTGQTSGYGYIVAKGEIPGAVWAHAGRDGDVNDMSDYQDAQGRMLPAARIRDLWREAGIVRERPVCFYCGTGWRASLAFFYAWLMGWEQISVYDGGWFEWSQSPPLATEQLSRQDFENHQEP